MKPNKNFHLNISDVELIEQALQHKISRLSEQRLLHIESTIKPIEELPRVAEIDQEIKQVRDLLGRIHNQKVWYRPQGAYVSG